MQIIAVVLCISFAAGGLTNRVAPREEPVQPAPIVKGNLPSQPDSTHYTILSYSKQFDNIFDDGHAASCSSAELASLKQLVEKAMHRYNSHKNMLDLPLEPFDTYYFQLVPVVDGRGDKQVWVNAFCSVEHARDWKSKLVTVQGGGNCYFNVKVNLTRGKAYDMTVNPGA